MFEDADDLSYRYDLTLPQGQKLAEVLESASVHHLADASVATAFLRRMHESYCARHIAEHVDDFVDEAFHEGVDNAGLWFMRSCVAEWRGEFDVQRSHLERALVQDATFGPALFDLGYLAFVAGDAGRATSLLGRSNDERAASTLHSTSHYPALPRPARNEPCPCGSGAKRKHCCGDHERHPLAHRARWLWEKAEAWLRRPAQNPAVWHVVEQLLGPEPGHEDVRALFRLPGFEGVALAEHGLLGRFLDGAGVLLPGDEYALAEQWLEVRHRVWSVESTEPGRWLVLEDVVTGEWVKASNGLVSRCTEPGEFAYGVVLPTTEGWMLPWHHVCISEDEAEAAAELLEAGIDPLLVASTIVRSGLRPSS